MSQENLERLRAYCESWETRAMPDLDLLDPEIVFEDDILPDHAGETYRGHEGVARATRTWLQPYEEVTIELEEIVGSGERLVSTHRFRAKGPPHRDRGRVALRLCVDVPGRKGDPPPVVSRARASARSRRAAGVDDRELSLTDPLTGHGCETARQAESR